MAEDAGSEGAKYWAFISYSHKDAGFGRRLHRSLESYTVPRRLVGCVGANGTVPRRLSPIFRDRDELPAANDLSAEVRTALNDSRSLIVVCSPAAAASEWVRREIELFRSLHPDRPVLAAIRSGEPAQCMPAALLRMDATEGPVEPLAADFRRGADGWQLGRLKLVAGMLGIGLGELLQRDSTRRLTRVTAVTGVALVAMLLMGTLTLFALHAQSEAERQRSEAEGLVEFMLTDLRDRLKGVGRLDLMGAVNERALKYYGDEDLAQLPVDSLERRARTLHAMGEDDEARGDEAAALEKFQEANRTTATLLAQSPNDPERIFTHAQTEFWLSSVEYERKNFAAAKQYLLVYKQLAERLVAIAPRNPKYRKEAAYADGDLCAIALGTPRDPVAAIRYCSSALIEQEEAAPQLPATNQAMSDLSNSHAWLADAYYYDKDYARAKSERLKEVQILERVMVADPKNMDVKNNWVVAQRALALLESQAGDKTAARTRLDRALAMVEDMIRFDPKNRDWTELRDTIEQNQSTLH